MQRRVPPIIRPRDPKPVLIFFRQQQNGDADLPRRGYQVEGRAPVVVADVGAGARPDQEGCDFSALAPRCEVQGGIAVLVGRIDVGALFYLEGCGGSESFHRCEVEGGVALLIAGVG
ncbi:unnamed protein product [Clonostachys byssicola]|uniref:Uncharacterized protein n=1 Tax=Clonostachys byssicola TaxID=160290 RepID=A0A9N9UF58_9HYPO|nr:unnamed protein product [Clonostachys byssicola]